MADEGFLGELNKAIAAFQKVDLDKVMRSNLGQESIEKQLTPLLEKMNEAIEYSQKYGHLVDNDAISNVAGIINKVVSIFGNLSQFNNQDFLTNKVNRLENVRSHVAQLRKYYPAFITAAILERGILEDEGIRRQSKEAIEEVRHQADEALNLLKEQAQKLMNEAAERADSIVNKARKTARKISVEEAQRQFTSAEADLKKKVKLWSWLTSASLFAFVGIAAYFMFCPPGLKSQWDAIYFSAIKVTILTSFGAIAAFSLRILRANMHMREHNLHRSRIANCIESFVVSAVTPEQGDEILGQLVEAVVDFGSSGLLRKSDDQISPARTTVENIIRRSIGSSHD